MKYLRPGPTNSVRWGGLCPDSHQVHQSDWGVPGAGGENHPVSDWPVQSWLSHQEISSQAGGHLSLCSLHYEVSLYWEGIRWNGKRNVIKLPIRSEPATLLILFVLRVCQQWTLRIVWSSVREPSWTSPSWPVSGRRLWWTALSESMSSTNINILIISGRGK